MSKARSPRDALLDHHRPTGHAGSLLPGVHNFVPVSGFPSLGSKLAGVRELDRDALHLGRDPVERVAKTEVGSGALRTARFAHLRDQGISVLAELPRPVRGSCVHVLVGRLQAELVRHGLEHDLTLEGLARLGLDVGLDLLRVRPHSWT